MNVAFPAQNARHGELLQMSYISFCRMRHSLRSAGKIPLLCLGGVGRFDGFRVSATNHDIPQKTSSDARLTSPYLLRTGTYTRDQVSGCTIHVTSLTSARHHWVR